MNKRIKELAGETLDHAMPQTWCSVSPDELDRILEKFAELIVKECVGLCSQAAEESARTFYAEHRTFLRTFYAVSETKEVGPALVAKGGQVQAEKLVKHIKQHFGVEE